MSVVWTNPLVATLGMSLTIPLAMLADMVVHGRHYSFIYILGSVQVLGIFPSSSIWCFLSLVTNAVHLFCNSSTNFGCKE